MEQVSCTEWREIISPESASFVSSFRGWSAFDCGRWEQMGQAKICVKCPTEAEMHDIQVKAQDAGLVNYLVVRSTFKCD